MFIQNLLKQKLPYECPGGGGQDLFWKMSKRKQLFFRKAFLTSDVPTQISSMPNYFKQNQSSHFRNKTENKKEEEENVEQTLLTTMVGV